MTQFNCVSMFSATLFGVTCLASMAVAQYFRPYPMSMDHFSPYQPARINHETLPISQAEFAQLVAESMATSNGPHHHHPPNTDQNYEPADHAAHDAEEARRMHHRYPAHSHHHHQDNNQYRNQEDDHDEHNQSQYQPDEHSESDQDEYHRAPVYENSYQNEGPDDEEEVGAATYGGRPGRDSYDHHPHQQQYEGHHPYHRPQYDGEESRMHSGRYMAAASTTNEVASKKTSA